MSNWRAVCQVSDIPVLGARRVARPGSIDIAVFRTAEDKVFALLDWCPHKGGPLSQGIVFGESVACPLHNWTIGLNDGVARAPDEGCVRRYQVQVDGGGTVSLDLDEVNAPEPVAAVPVAPVITNANDSAGSNTDHPARR